MHRDATAQPFADLQKAFVNFWKGNAEYPRFKKKGKSRDSFYVANDKFHVIEKTVILPNVGAVKMREALRFDGKILSATVSREADRWAISIQVELPEDYQRQRTADGQVGVDLGITHFATLSTGEVIDGPKPLKHALNNSNVPTGCYTAERKAVRTAGRPNGGSRKFTPALLTSGMILSINSPQSCAAKTKPSALRICT